MKSSNNCITLRKALFTLWGIFSLALPSLLFQPVSVTASTDSNSEEEIRGEMFRNFMEHVDKIYFHEDKNAKDLTMDQKEHLVLSSLLREVNMDPAVIDQRPLQYNWMEDLHTRTLALAPSSSFWKVFLRRPNKEEFDSIANFDVYAQAQSNSIEDLRRFAFSPHRDRGMVAALSVTFSSMVLQPIQHFAGYATPTKRILTRLAEKYPAIVEVGAGNGYWSAALELEGANVIAYDSIPPTTEEDQKNPNLFSHVATPFTTVNSGACSDIFGDDNLKDDLGKRALLIIWPNNPDHVDNPTHHSSTGDVESIEIPVWDADCLQAYLDAGGSTVIFVGEREEKIGVRRDFPPDVGMSASKRFQTMLKEKFSIGEQFEIPHWWGEDDVTVWEIGNNDEL
jgi:hypothetical protein